MNNTIVSFMQFILTNTPFYWLFQSYWRDEAFSVVLAKKPVFELLAISAKDFSPPLYYLILKIWIFIFGSSEVAARSLSILSFSAMIIALLLFFKVVKHYNCIQLFIISIFSFTIPILTYYAFEARMYSLSAFFVTCSWIALFTKRKNVYTAITIIGFYTHYLHVLIFFCQMVYLLLEIVIEKRDVTNLVSKLFAFTRIWKRQFIVIFLLYTPWVIYVFLSHMGSNSSFWIKHPSIAFMASIPTIQTTGYETDSNFKYDLLIPTVSLYLFVILATFTNFSRPNWKKTYDFLKSEQFAYILWFFIPAVIVIITGFFGLSLFLPRYLIVSSPAIIFIAANELKNKRHLVSLIFIIFIVWQFNNYQSLQIKMRKKENLKSVFAEINKNTKSNDVLYLESELDYHLAEYYFRNPKSVYVVGKPYSQLPSYVGKAMIPEEHVSISRPQDETGFWLFSDRTVKRIE